MIESGSRRFENRYVVVGITDYAQLELGDVVFVELPGEGDSVSKGDSFGTVESVKAVSDLYSPVDGTVVAVNEGLADAPESVNSSPFEEGWMIKVQPSDASQLEEMMDAGAYAAFVDELSK